MNLASTLAAIRTITNPRTYTGAVVVTFKDGRVLAMECFEVSPEDLAAAVSPCDHVASVRIF